MNKIRYWKRIAQYCEIVYRHTKGNIQTRAYYILGDINDYLYNLEDD